MFLYKKKKGKSRCSRSFRQNLKSSEKELVKRAKPKTWKDRVLKVHKSQLNRAQNSVWLSTLHKGLKITSIKLTLWQIILGTLEVRDTHRILVKRIKNRDQSRRLSILHQRRQTLWRVKPASIIRLVDQWSYMTQRTKTQPRNRVLKSLTEYPKTKDTLTAMSISRKITQILASSQIMNLQIYKQFMKPWQCFQSITRDQSTSTNRLLAVLTLVHLKSSGKLAGLPKSGAQISSFIKMKIVSWEEWMMKVTGSHLKKCNVLKMSRTRLDMSDSGIVQ